MALLLGQAVEGSCGSVVLLEVRADAGLLPVVDVASHASRLQLLALVIDERGPHLGLRNRYVLLGEPIPLDLNCVLAARVTRARWLFRHRELFWRAIWVEALVYFLAAAGSR